MPFHVVCISHSQEAGGDQVARAVAGRLGFRYVDEEIIARAANIAQVDPEVVAAAERKQTLLRRFFDALASATAIGSPLAIASGLPTEMFPDSLLVRGVNDDLRILIRAAIQEVAKAGDAVIVAHAASLALAGTPGVLRVLVTAPSTVRSERLAQSSLKTIAEASAIIAESDSGRANYFRTFYEVPEESPTHYDLVINTEALTAEQAADLIVAAARG
jgi:cytidylate kinase